MLSESIAISLFSLTRNGEGLKHVERTWRESLFDQLRHAVAQPCLNPLPPDAEAIAHNPAHMTRYFPALGQLSATYNARYIITGTFEPIMADTDANRVESLSLALCMYDACKQAFFIRQIGPLKAFQPGCDTLDTLRLDAEVLRQAVRIAVDFVDDHLSAPDIVSDIAFEDAIVDERLDDEPPVMTIPVAPEGPASYEALQELLNNTQSPEAETLVRIGELEQANAEGVETPQLHEELGRLYKAVSAVKKSVFHYRRAFEVSAGDKDAQARYATEAGIGCALLEQSDFAIGWWLKAIEVKPDVINPYMNIAHTYEEDHHYDQAEAYLLKAAQIAPQDFRISISLARIYSKLSDWEKAIEQYEKQLLSDPDDPWCHSDIATSYLQMGDMVNAIKHLEKTVELDEDGEAGQYAKLVLMELVASSK